VRPSPKDVRLGRVEVGQEKPVLRTVQEERARLCVGRDTLQQGKGIADAVGGVRLFQENGKKMKRKTDPCM
jgi:hypothetical protein